MEAARRNLEFQLGWFLDPIYFGDYPKSMQDAIGSRLPLFSREEIKKLQEGSLDFIGLNHYITRYITLVVTSSQSTSLHLKKWPNGQTWPADRELGNQWGLSRHVGSW